MERRTVHTAEAPRAIGPYSQAVVAGGWVFVSGQVAIDPATGELIDGDVRAQTRRVLQSLSAILSAAGTGWERVVKCTVYLRDLGDFAAVNEVYGSVFTGSDPPARATVEVGRLPLDAAVEIDVIAMAS